MGASISSMADMFNKFDYALVCCNAHSGNNAFFIKREYEGLFPEVPKDIKDIFSEPRYHLYTGYAHRVSPVTVRKLFQRAAPSADT